MSRSAKKSKPLSARQRRAKLLDRLVMAMDRCALARGEAQWTNGYRARVGLMPAVEESLYAKEKAQWAHVARTERAFRSLALSVLRASSTGDGNG